MRLAAIDVVLAFLLLVAALLVFPGLGATRLWEDEAHTAVIAKNVMQSGLPLASDGRNTVSVFPDGRDVRGGVYIWSPWLPHYLAAASMAVFGTNSFGARFPFALSFVLLVFACHRLFARWQSDRVAGRVALALMVGSVVMLLHARECRYYALAALLSVLVVDAHLRLRAGEGRPAILRLTLFASLLFNSFPPGAALLAIALGIDWLRALPTRAVARDLALAAIAIALVNLPLAIYLRVWDRQFGVQPGYSDPAIFALYLLRYLLSLNLFFFPGLLVVLAAALRWRSIASGRILRDDFSALLLTVCAVTLLGFALLSDYPFTRYLIATAPFVFFLGARCLVALSAGRSWAVWLLTTTLLGTNLLGLPPLLLLRPTALGGTPWSTAGIDPDYVEPGEVGRSIARGEIGALTRTPLGSPLLDFLRALRSPSRGPIDVLVSYLEAEAEPSDLVIISSGGVPLMFHTELQVKRPGDEGAERLRFYVPRHFWPVSRDQIRKLWPKDLRIEEVRLGVPDFQWNDRPDPLYHRFETARDPEAPELRIFRFHASER